ncbi:hypothetical protein LTR10_008767 [Elasticomyces elasticus]|nr:hypothetical protein LTR10_008767 [Elasticomyces elasticus]KAK4974259.1 hypothetical protein LTR42_004901 [Elasticomyces elasticus]
MSEREHDMKPTLQSFISSSYQQSSAARKSARLEYRPNMSGQNSRTFYPRGYHDSGFHPRRIPVAEPHQIPVVNLRPTLIAEPHRSPVADYHNSNAPDCLLPTARKEKFGKQISRPLSMYSSDSDANSADEGDEGAQEAMGSESAHERSQACYEALLAEQQALAEDGEHIGRAEMPELHELISRVRRELEEDVAPSRRLANVC